MASSSVFMCVIHRMPLGSTFTDELVKFNRPTGVRVGNNISSKQADVEVLAVLTKALPTTMTAFDEARGEREFYSMQAMILKVGVPGFSSVPYIANSKGKEKQIAKPLYSKGENNETLFFSFEKGKTNKDKGERCESYKVDDVDTSCKVSLRPGCCLSNFLRSDCFEKGKFFVEGTAGELEKATENGLLTTGKLVYIQLSSQNVEQAKKGYMLKMRKLKIAKDAEQILLDESLPKSQKDFEAMMQSMQLQKAIEKQVYAGHSYTVAMKFSNDSFLNYDEDLKRFVICRNDEEHPEIEVKSEVMQMACASQDNDKMMRIASLAASTGQMSALVRCSQVGDVDVQGQAADSALLLYIDTERMLHLENLQSYVLQQGMPSHFEVVEDKEYIYWCDRENLVKLQHDEQNVVFCVSKEKKCVDAPEPTCTQIISEGEQGHYYDLYIYLDKKISKGGLKGFVDSIKSKFLFLNVKMRIPTANQCAKRRRVAFMPDTKRL